MSLDLKINFSKDGLLKEAKKADPRKNTWVKIFIHFNMERIKIENILHLEKKTC